MQCMECGNACSKEYEVSHRAHLILWIWDRKPLGYLCENCVGKNTKRAAEQLREDEKIPSVYR